MRGFHGWEPQSFVVLVSRRFRLGFGLHYRGFTNVHVSGILDGVKANPKTRRRFSYFCLAGLSASALVIAAGLAWSHWGTPRAVWSDAKAAQYKAAFQALHAATSGHVEGRPNEFHEPDPAEVAKARERFKQISRELESARFAHGELGSWIAWLGLASAAGFGVGYGATRG